MFAASSGIVPLRSSMIQSPNTTSLGITDSGLSRGSRNDAEEKLSRGEEKYEDISETAVHMLSQLPRGKLALEHSTLNGLMREQLLEDLGQVSSKPKQIYQVLKQAGG